MGRVLCLPGHTARVGHSTALGESRPVMPKGLLRVFLSLEPMPSDFLIGVSFEGPHVILSPL